MKIVVFGATGPAGRLTVREALAQGHSVTVYARNPAKTDLRATDLTIKAGELSDAKAINEVIAGQDAVISVLGPSKGSTGTPLTDGMKLIVAAMKRHGVSRLIATSTPAFRSPTDRFSFPFWLAVGMIRLTMPGGYRDIVGAAQTVSDAALNWTIVRLPMLSDKEVDGEPAAGPVGAPGVRLFSLSRNVLAKFLIHQLSDTAWLRQTPVISNGQSGR